MPCGRVLGGQPHEVVAAFDVVVEAGHAHTQPLGHRLHGDPVQSDLVRGLRDHLAVEARRPPDLGPLHRLAAPAFRGPDFIHSITLTDLLLTSRGVRGVGNAPRLRARYAATTGASWLGRGAVQDDAVAPEVELAQHRVDALLG